LVKIRLVTAEILLPKSLCGGGGAAWLIWWSSVAYMVVRKPILVFSLSLSQAQQNYCPE